MTKTTPRLVHLVNVVLCANIKNPKGLNAFDAWDKMLKDILFNKQLQMSNPLLSNEGQEQRSCVVGDWAKMKALSSHKHNFPVVISFLTF